MKGFFFFILSPFFVGVKVSIAADNDAYLQLLFFLKLKEECALELLRQSVKNVSHRPQLKVHEGQLGRLRVFLPKLKEQLLGVSRILQCSAKDNRLLHGL